MNTKNIENKPMDGTKFLDMLSTISLEEILQFEFRLNPTSKWETLVVAPETPLRKYKCNICNVVQFGDKNLFGHLCGKKHNSAMAAEQQLQFRIKPIGAPQKPVSETVKKGPNTITNNNKNSTSPVVKNLPILNKNAPNKNSDTNTTVVKQTAGNEVSKIQPIQKKSPAIGVNKQNIASPKATTQKNIQGNNPNIQKNIQGNSPNIQKNVSVNILPNQKNTSENNTPTKKNTGNNIPVQKNISVIDAQKRPNPIPGNNQAKKATVNAANATNTANKKAPQSAAATANTSQNSGGPAPKTTVSSTTPQHAADGQTQKQSQAQTEPPVQNPAHTQTKPQPTKAVQNARSNDADLERNKTTIPNIVKNPLAKKISCVPLAKLINSTPEPDNDVIIIDELPKEAAKPPETPKNLIPVRATNQNSTIAAKKPSNIAAPPVRPTATNKVVRPTYGAPKDHPAARPGGTFESGSQNHVMGLVGVEYVLKIVRNLADKNARYQCCLCEITADEQSMHNHLLAYNHRLKYFDKHFPTAMRLYRQYVSQVPESEVCKIMMPIFDKLAHAIETHHGRKSAHLCYDHVYSKDRQSLFTQVYNRKHSSEKIGPSFTHVVDANEVEELINKVRNNVQPLTNIENPNPYYVSPYVPHYVGYQNAPEKSTQPPVDDETHKRMVDNFLRDTRHSSGDVYKSRQPKRNRSRSKSPDQRKRVTHKRHWNVERWSVSPLRDGDLWQAYRHMVDHKVRELNVVFDTYKSDPEQHPNYQAEWQMFWKRRRDELILAGINHRTYNFQNEWIHFFNARIEELYNQDIENIKIKCRERLCLPMTNNELTDERYYVHLGKTDEPDLRKSEPRNEPRKMLVDGENLAVEPPNVIHVLRLLTALENDLGSLGPFVTEMLVKALQTQKTYPEKVHTSILTNENCAILETVKEKFTGLLISKIYDPAKERALKRAIIDTNFLLQSASKLNNSKDNAQRAEQPDMANKKLYGPDKPLDKTELAAKLASSLVSQGKTSINREELQKILQVYTMIEQKKRQDIPSSSSSMNLLPSTSTNLIPNSNNNDNLLTQHSSRNLNIAINAKQPNNPTSMHTGHNYSGNVARFNNQQSTNLANTSNAYPTDRGFGGSGGYNSQFGSALPAINPSSVLRNDLTTSSLFNFNTNLNPSYNNPNRRNPNF